MTKPARLFLDIAVRTVVLVAGDWVYREIADHSPLGDDALGAGLLDFALVIAFAGLWAALDGTRQGLRRTTAVWVSVGVLGGIATTVVFNLMEAPLDTGVLRADLGDTAPFLAGLVIVPALVAAALGAVVRRAAAPRPTR
ncbi:MAG: hypothetical protein ACR2FG_09525 [Marmoricola sp.]